jgi:hypothetical protein
VKGSMRGTEKRKSLLGHEHQNRFAGTANFAAGNPIQLAHSHDSHHVFSTLPASQNFDCCNVSFLVRSCLSVCLSVSLSVLSDPSQIVSRRAWQTEDFRFESAAAVVSLTLLVVLAPSALLDHD